MRFKGMDLVIYKMSSPAKFCEKMVNKMSSATKYGERNDIGSDYIIKSFLKKGYVVKIDDANFLLFEKEKHYLHILYLEIMLFDLFENMKFAKEEKEIKVSDRLALLTKFVENLNKIMLLSFCGENENVYEIKFPYLWYMKKFRSLNEHDNILDYLNKWEDLDEWEYSLVSEENNIISLGIEYPGYQEDDYGNDYVERLREIGFEMEALTFERKRRYEILRDKFFDLNRKIKKLICIKRYKVKV